MMNRAPELSPVLQAENPSLATRKHYALAKLGGEANLLVQLIEQLKNCTGLRPCDPHGDFYAPDEHLRAIERGDFKRALRLIGSHGISTPNN